MDHTRGSILVRFFRDPFSELIRSPQALRLELFFVKRLVVDETDRLNAKLHVDAREGFEPP